MKNKKNILGLLVLLAIIITAINSYAEPAREDAIASTTVLAYEDSPLGVFAAFAANEFSYFNQRMGFTTPEQYWDWAEAHMQNLGAHWTRSNLQFVWDFIEPVIGGGYNWDNQMLTDPIIKRIYRPGNEVHWLGVFHEGGGPVVEPGKPILRNPLDYPQEYQAFVQAVVERFDGDGIDDASAGVKVKYWQVGNEILPWKVHGKTVQDYILWVRMVRAAVKAADPEAKIVLMASMQGLTVDPDLQQIIEALAGEGAFEVLDIHHWGEADNWKMTAVPQYRQILDARGLTQVQIWSCEHGTWQGQPRGESFQSESDQARSLVKRYVYNLAHGLNKLFWNNLMEWNNFGGGPGSVFNSMGLVSDGQGPGEDPTMFNVPRLAYYSYKKLAETLEAADKTSWRAIQEKDGVYLYQFTRQGKPCWVAWTDSGKIKLVTLSNLNSAKVTVTKAVPKYSSGKYVSDYNTAFTTATKTVFNGKIWVILRDSPVYIE